jgi:molybdenum cofactor guanylyltransferase
MCAMLSRPCAAAILAGGRAERLNGADKSQLVVGGRTILARQLAVLRRLTPTVFLVGGVSELVAGQAGELDAAPLETPLARVPDLAPDLGPLGGIGAALAHAPLPCTIIVACDMPFLTLAFLEHLVERIGGVDVAVPRTEDGYHPLCAAYHRSVLPEVTARLARRALAVRDLFRAVRVAEIGPATIARFDPDGLLLSNVNTPQDYDRACARAGRL